MHGKRSADLVEQAKRVMPGGVNSPERSFAGVETVPLIVRRGQGAVIYDQDDNAYTDYCLARGALIFGHAHRNVVLATKKAAERGLNLGFTTQAEVDLARWIIASFPGMDQVRFVSSETEALIGAVRLARAVNGRKKIVCFSTDIYGPSGEFLSGPFTDGGFDPVDVIELPFNNPDMLAAAFERNPGQIAAVLVEPAALRGGALAEGDRFVGGLRALTRQHGALLILNEITTAFRRERGGAQTRLNLQPDLTCLGRIIGGGLPVGAVGGRREFMKQLAPDGAVPLGGTFGGNPVVMRAGLSTLKLLNDDFYRVLNSRSEALAGRLNDHCAEKDLLLRVDHYGPMFRLRFLDASGRQDGVRCSFEQNKTYVALFKYLLQNNILLPPDDREPFFVCGKHTDRDLERLGALIESFFCCTLTPHPPSQGRLGGGR